MLVSGLRGVVDESIEEMDQGPPHRRYLPMIGTLAIFIGAANLFGIFFFLQPPTGALSTTVALALVSFVYFNTQGIREHGFFKYLQHFMGPLIWIAPLFFVIEIIGTFARILSLSLRLFMNIYGEHTTTNVFASLVPDRRSVADDGARHLHGIPAGLRLRAALGGLRAARDRPRRALIPCDRFSQPAPEA